MKFEKELLEKKAQQIRTVCSTLEEAMYLFEAVIMPCISHEGDIPFWNQVKEQVVSDFTNDVPNPILGDQWTNWYLDLVAAMMRKKQSDIDGQKMIAVLDEYLDKRKESSFLSDHVYIKDSEAYVGVVSSSKPKGLKVYELIYGADDKVVGSKELDPNTLTKKYSESDGQFVWIQYEDQPAHKRILFENQVKVIR